MTHLGRAALAAVVTLVFISCSADDESTRREPEARGEPMEITEMAHHSTRATGGDDHYIHWVAVLKNPNTELFGDTPVVTITARDDSGTVVGTEDQFLDSLPPGGTTAFAGQVTATSEPETVEIKAKTVDYRSTTTAPSDYLAFEVDGPSLTKSDVALRVTGDISNPYSQAIESLAVVALLRDDDGTLIGGHTAFLDDLPAQGSLPFAIDVYDPPSEPTRAEIFATPWVTSVSWEDLAREG